MSKPHVGQAGTEEVTVVFVCEWCGGRVELHPSDAGIEVTDARAFLDEHAACLRRGAELDLIPRQR